MLQSGSQQQEIQRSSIGAANGHTDRTVSRWARSQAYADALALMHCLKMQLRCLPNVVDGVVRVTRLWRHGTGSMEIMITMKRGQRLAH